MRRRLLVSLGAIVFIIWNAVTYFLFSSRPDSPGSGVSVRRQSDLLSRIQDLEDALKGQMENNERLLYQLRANTTSSHSPSSPPLMTYEEEEPSLPVVSTPQDDRKKVIAVLIMACNRETVSRALDQIIRYRQGMEDIFPLIVSQDCNHKPTSDVIDKYSKYLTHIKQPDQSNPVVATKQRPFVGYYKISRHYKWALDQVFYTLNHTAVLIVEDDLDLSPDFFSYFSAGYDLLRRDPSLWCVSAWNDNGKFSLIENNPELLFRTDFFPGLGWMMLKETWNELSPKWPPTFWDDWMRKPEQRLGRSCIRPEISRTKTFGKIGVSKGQYFDKVLKFIQLNSKAVSFSNMNVGYLVKNEYDVMFKERVYSSPEVKLSDVTGGKAQQLYPPPSSVRVTYTTLADLKKILKSLGAMDDVKSGVARQAYLGVVGVMRDGQRVYVAPQLPWDGYDPSWS